MGLNDFNTVGKVIYVGSTQIEPHFQNVGPKTNKLNIEVNGEEPDISILTGTYTVIEDLIESINQTLESAGHEDIIFNFIQVQSRVQIKVDSGKT